MSEVARIADQLKTAIEGDAWHGQALQEILADVSHEQAAARPLAGAHNIWEIVLHITAWLEVVRERFQGRTVELNEAGDWPAVVEQSAESWAKALDGLSRSKTALLDLLSPAPDSKLNESVPGTGYSVYFMLHGVIQHSLYHAGQIALLKKG